MRATRGVARHASTSRRVVSGSTHPDDAANGLTLPYVNFVFTKIGIAAPFESLMRSAAAKVAFEKAYTLASCFGELAFAPK